MYFSIGKVVHTVGIYENIGDNVKYNSNLDCVHIKRIFSVKSDKYANLYRPDIEN